MKRKKVQVFDIVNNIILLLVAVICIYPFLYVFLWHVATERISREGRSPFFQRDLILRLLNILWEVQSFMYGLA